MLRFPIFWNKPEPFIIPEKDDSIEKIQVTLQWKSISEMYQGELEALFTNKKEFNYKSYITNYGDVFIDSYLDGGTIKNIKVIKYKGIITWDQEAEFRTVFQFSDYTFLDYRGKHGTERNYKFQEDTSKYSAIFQWSNNLPKSYSNYGTEYIRGLYSEVDTIQVPNDVNPRTNKKK